jgi:hypothetical protein
MADRVRFHAHPAARVSTDHAVQIVRNYDGHVFSMSANEARDLAYELDRAADQADAKRKVSES